MEGGRREVAWRSVSCPTEHLGSQIGSRPRTGRVRRDNSIERDLRADEEDEQRDRSPSDLGEGAASLAWSSHWTACTRAREIYLGVERDLHARQAVSAVHAITTRLRGDGGAASGRLRLTLRSGADTSGMSGKNGRTKSSIRNPAILADVRVSCGCRPRGATTWGAERRAGKRRSVRRSNGERKGRERRGKEPLALSCTRADRASRGESKADRLHLDHVAPFIFLITERHLTRTQKQHARLVLTTTR